VIGGNDAEWLLAHNRNLTTDYADFADSGNTSASDSAHENRFAVILRCFFVAAQTCKRLSTSLMGASLSAVFLLFFDAKEPILFLNSKPFKRNAP
jgi:hypothetical protein